MNENQFENRIHFLESEQIMEVDFSDITFDTSAMVDEFYDAIEKGVAQRGNKKWYFLVNYRNTRIFELAWIRFAQRGKRLNLASSQGSVRYAARSDVGESILSSAQKENFDPNLFDSREDALAEIQRMKDASAADS